MKKIFVFGDSILKGVVFENGNYKKCNNDICSQISALLGYKIENHSVFGQTLSRLDTKPTLNELLKNNNDCYFVLELGGNDADFCWDDVCKNPTAPQTEKTPQHEYANMLTQTINKIKSSGNTPLLCNLPPVSATRYYQFLCNKYDGNKILQFFNGDITNISRHQEFYNNLLEKVGQKTKTPVLDLRNELLVKIDYEKYLCADGIHPNEQGYKLLANSIANQINDISQGQK